VDAPAPSWFQRKKRWLIPSLLVGQVLCCCLAGGGGGAWAWFTKSDIEASQPYNQSLVLVFGHGPTSAQLGWNMDVRFGPFGWYRESDGEGEARFYYSVEGSKGSAQVSVQATLEDGEWTIDQLTVTVDDSDREYTLIENREVLPP
jgi:hypothetical protein